MNIQLKAGFTFEHPDNHATVSELFGGLKNLNMSVDDWTLNFKLKFFVSEELMQEGVTSFMKKPFLLITMMQMVISIW